MIIDLLAAFIIIFLFWGDDNGVDNWDKLNIIIDTYYEQAIKNNY